MNQTLVAIVIGLAVAAGTVFLLDGLRSEGAGAGPAADLTAIERRLESIEERLGGQPAGLATQGLHPDLIRRLERIEGGLAATGALRGSSAAEGEEGAAASPFARIEERLASIEEHLTGEDGEKTMKVRPQAKRRVSLAEAAQELELSVQEQDDLKRIYDEFHNKMFKYAAGKDGNPDDVRRDVMEAKDDPMKATGLMTKYLPNVMGNIGGLIMAQQEREQAIQRVLGPDKARRLNRDFDVKEDNLLGFGGGGFQTEMRVGGDGR